jgi:protein-S-isoprenylcysteine O-methyltransferase Ste14
MPNPDYLLYTVHYACWTIFGITLLVMRFMYGRSKESVEAPLAKEAHTAGHSRALVAFHAVAFGVMYFGMAVAVFGHRVPVWFTGQRVAGTVVIATGWILGMSAMFYFRSWRFRAALDQGHELATGGPFRLVRHPIYSAAMLALNTTIWAYRRCGSPFC